MDITLLVVVGVIGYLLGRDSKKPYVKHGYQPRKPSGTPSGTPPDPPLGGTGETERMPA